MIKELYEFIEGFIAGLRPEPRLTVAEWAATNRYLSSSESATPGKWDNNLCPYLVEIMECLSISRQVQQIIAMKGAQLGFTECANNLIGYIIDQAPCKIMMVQPTDDVAKEMSKTRIAPMLESTESLAIKVKPSRSRDSGNTTKLKQFAGGALRLCGANSPVALRNFAARFLVLDEIDAYPEDLGNEGSPIALAQARNRTFGRRAKTYMLSTPTVAGKSLIEIEFLKTDQRYYFCPCPHCGFEQRFEWKQMKWKLDEHGSPIEVHYECLKCIGKIEERHKGPMMIKGSWKPTVPANIDSKVRGYHISSLYSPSQWLPWEKIVKMWLKAQGNNNELKTFTNTVLGEPWVEKGDAPDWKNIYNKRIEYKFNTINNEVCFITVGVDIQKGRIEAEVVGWCRNRVSYSIAYHQFMGDTDTAQSEVWARLNELLNEVWVRPDRLVLPVLTMAVDTGYNTHTVYEFCRLSGGRAIPIKGGHDTQLQVLTQPRVVDVNYEGKKVGAVQLWTIGVGILKKEFYGHLQLFIGDSKIVPPGYCFFPQYSEEHFKGLTAESFLFKINRLGRKKWQWTKTFERNEPLDCRVYARAAAAIIGMDLFTDDEFEAVLNACAEADQPQEKKQPPKNNPPSIWDKKG